MKELDLKSPNILVKYAEHKDGVCFRYFPEIEKSEYSYQLIEGERVYRIAYKGTNYDAIYDVTIHEITDEGLIVSSPNHYEDFKQWNKEQTAYQIVKKASNHSFLMPFKKWLPDADWWKECDIVIEPLPPLYEKNKFADVISGKARTSGIYDGCPFKDTISGEGLFYSTNGHGRRTTSREYEEKLKRFIRTDAIIQLSLFEEERE